MAQRTAKPGLANVKACVFDIFGTVVDWRSSVIAEATTWGEAKGLNINWAEFTDRWPNGEIFTSQMISHRLTTAPGRGAGGTACSF